MAERHGYGIHDGLAQATQHQDQDGNALDEDDSHRSMPITASNGSQRIGDDCVDAHARGAGKWPVRKHAHKDCHDAGAEAGRRHCGGDRNTCFR